MRTGIVTGAFDLLHAGHLHFLHEAQEKCDYLIVLLHVDPSLERSDKNKPIESLMERGMRLKACRYVNYFTIYEKEEELASIFKIFKPDVRFLGSDYKDTDKPVTEPDAVPIEYIDSLDIHTSDLRKRL